MRILGLVLRGTGLDPNDVMKAVGGMLLSNPWFAHVDWQMENTYGSEPIMDMTLTATIPYKEIEQFIRLGQAKRVEEAYYRVCSGSDYDFVKSYNSATRAADKLPKLKIVNDNAAVLFWSDGSKTVVKRSQDDVPDPVKAFLWAYFLHGSGMSRTKANKFLASLVEREEHGA